MTEAAASPADPSSVEGAKPKRERLLSLDVMRGLTILAMILVNNPGTWDPGGRYAALDHAAWHGCTPTDLIFPFFLFMVGVAMAYSFARYTDGDGRATPAVWARIGRRVATLIALGLFLNASGRLISVPLGYSDNWGWETLRWPGVLQRIGLVYLIASMIVLRNRQPIGRFVSGLSLLVLYTLLVSFYPQEVPAAERLGKETNVVRSVDLAVLGENHLWGGSPTDPEGSLSTLPAAVTTLLGYAIGRFLRTAPLNGVRVLRIAGTGLPLAIAGYVWGELPHPGIGMPVNKALWTPSFVWLTGGLAMLVLAACLAVFDLWGKNAAVIRRVATAFEMVGVNAIFVFVASGFVARMLGIFEIGETSVKGWLYQNLCVEPLTSVGLADVRLHSLAYAAGFVACWWCVLWAMWRRGWSIRV
ncbi:MAG: DUF5009 domain-containing protein [Planctomycetota bacterium]